MEKLCYPKMIQKPAKKGEVLTMVVKDAYEHAAKVKEGWSGPPEWESALPTLEEEISETEIKLAEMKERLIYMKEFEKKRDDPNP